GRDAADELTQDYRYGGSLSYLQAFNRLNVRLTGRVTRNDYQDAGDFDNNDRDNLIYDAILRTGFYVSPRINLFVQGSYNIERRDEKVDDAGIERDNEGWGASVGSEIGITDLLTGEFHVGYVRQSFEQAGFEDEQGVGYGVDLIWLPTRLTTVDLTGSGDFEPTTTTGAESRFRNAAGIQVNHELLRNVRLNGRLGYIRDDFRGTDRVDDTVRAGAGASYLINRNFSLDAGYTFTNRWSDDSDEEFTNHVIRLGVTAQL
ncbi:MAG: outer membrane beta-barrel protein, partial [Geminicoccaceae bacterium]